jgi:hypothetical protein
LDFSGGVEIDELVGNYGENGGEYVWVGGFRRIESEISIGVGEKVGQY